MDCGKTAFAWSSEPYWAAKQTCSCGFCQYVTKKTLTSSNARSGKHETTQSGDAENVPDCPEKTSPFFRAGGLIKCRVVNIAAGGR